MANLLVTGHNVDEIAGFFVVPHLQLTRAYKAEDSELFLASPSNAMLLNFRLPLINQRWCRHDQGRLQVSTS